MKTNILVFFLIASLYSCNDRKLPFYGNKTIEEKVIDGKTVYDTIPHTVADFQFLNQDSTLISQKNIEGKIYLADFFFTSCFTICPKVKKQMKRVYEVYKDNPNFVILSHSIDYRNDTVGRLAWYANKFDIDSKKWHLLTGSYDELLRMSYQYLLTALEDDGAEGGFDHSGNIVLIDKKRRIRGSYDGLDPDKVDQLIKDIQLLIDEK